MAEDEPLNDLKPDEVNAGPAVGMEQRLLRSIDHLLQALKANPDDPKIKTVLDHNQGLLDSTGPKRKFGNKNDKKRVLRGR